MAEQQQKEVSKEGTNPSTHDEEEEKVSTSALKQNPYEGMTEEQKNLQMKLSLESLINQMEPRMRSLEERRNMDRLRHMLPLYDKHAFWDSQPVPKNLNVTAVEEKEGEIEHREVKDVQKEPYALPAGFEWTTIDIADDNQVNEVYELLRNNYVEDSESTFRFDYPVEFIRWALAVPGYNKEWHVGVRVSKTKKLYGFISGTPVKLNINDHTVRSAEVNYLCVSKKLREKRLAPVLIKEVTRRINLSNVW